MVRQHTQASLRSKMQQIFRILWLTCAIDIQTTMQISYGNCTKNGVFCSFSNKRRSVEGWLLSIPGEHFRPTDLSQFWSQESKEMLTFLSKID